jgi:hypothetical protein
MRGRALLLLALAGCGTHHAARPTAALKGPCPVTVPGPVDKDGFNYGTAGLKADIWPGGKLPAGPLPGGGSYARVEPDGSIVAKLGWWRGKSGRLKIDGRRLDRAAPGLRADIPCCYGPSGFQATGVTFPTTGCWRVTGRVGDASLTFDVSVSIRARS